MHPDLPPSPRAGADLRALAERWGTPLFVYEPAVVDDRYGRFRTAFAAAGVDVLVAYSYKTNYLPALCARLHRLGAGAEVVCAAELELAHALGVPPERRVLNGVVKDEPMLASAVRDGCLVVNLESDAEVAALEALAERHGVREVPVGVRVNLDIYPFGDPPYEPWLVAARKFGHDLASGDALAFCRRVAGARRLRLRGLHAHLGSQITDAAPFERALDLLEDLAGVLRGHGVAIDCVDLGGGFPAQGMARVHRDRYDAAAPEARDALLAHAASSGGAFDLARVAARLARWRVGAPVRFVCEPGRALVAEAMRFVTCIHGIKTSRGRTWLLLDGGVSHLPTVMPNEVHPLELIGGGAPGNDAEGGTYTLAGPGCFRSDVFAFDARLGGTPRVGDLVAIGNVGAYSVSMAAPFNVCRAPIVAVEAGRDELVWRREAPAEVFQFDTTGVFRPPGSPGAGR